MSELSRIIAAEIRQTGPIPLARFMEMALYCPVYGYYERDSDSVGRRGDFLTSVSVGPVFGELLAFQFAAWLDAMSDIEGGDFHLVEAGGQDGKLARDILHWIELNRADLLGRIQFHFVEPSSVHRQWQKSCLADLKTKPCWSSNLSELNQRTGGVRGVIFCNELLDAQPLHRFAWDKRSGIWFEWLIGLNKTSFEWVRGEAPVLDVEFPAELLNVLPDGFVVERSPAARQWWADAAHSLKQGWLVTFDYGDDENTILIPERKTGTLRGYRSHAMVSNVLADPGEQDITAHVQFGEMIEVGNTSGLKTEFFGEQGRFLTRLLQQSLTVPGSEPEFPPDRMQQIKTLIHPDHFGHSFKVLVQSRLPAIASDL